MALGEVIFFVVAAVAIGSALAVILHPHPVYSALALIVTLFQIAVLFLLLDAQMVAFLQILVYAGAIMVLFLFVIMLLNLEREPEPPSAGWRLGLLTVGGLLAFEFAWFFLRRLPRSLGPGATLDPDYGSVAALARSLFRDHALSFELTSILLLVAVVGAVVLAKRGPE
ncbi:MAG TPA: NADH-quinone oxidoreductase subunit J [Candidatus Binatia bacterium]|nr:NADH-quinone oxidoreductase subunit J [Candidatus Binatia bacterium]